MYPPPSDRRPGCGRGGHDRGGRDRVRRSGFALAVALGALVVIAALAAGLVFVAQQQERAARNALAGERALAAAPPALAAAEELLAGVPGAWSGPELAALALGEAREHAATSRAGDSVVTRVTRVAARTVWVVVDARAGAGTGQGRRRLAALFALVGAVPESTRVAPVTPRAWTQTF